MLQDLVNPQEEELSMEEALPSSPIDPQLLDFADDADLFSEAILRSSEVSCSSATTTVVVAATVDSASCSYNNETSFAGTELSPFLSMDTTTFSSLLESQPPDPEPDDFIPTIDNDYSEQELPVFPPQLSGQQDQFDQLAAYSASYSDSMVPMPVNAQLQPQPPQGMLLPLYEDQEGLMPGYVGLEPMPSSSCSFLDPGMSSMYTGSIGFSMSCGGGGMGDGQGGSFIPGMVVGGETGLGLQELAEYQNAAMVEVQYGMEPMQHGYNSREFQVIGDRQQQQLVGRCNSPAPLHSDMSSLDESSFKVGRLSAEERKEKIHRYMKKRNERNFNKKIKYACRKTLADSRPRVRGRFAKNEEFGEAARPTSSSNNEYDDDDEVAVKEEDIFDSSDILAHISGVNSFKYNYTLESWI